jgi:hypothetical protein
MRGTGLRQVSTSLQIFAGSRRPQSSQKPTAQHRIGRVDGSRFCFFPKIGEQEFGLFRNRDPTVDAKPFQIPLSEPTGRFSAIDSDLNHRPGWSSNPVRRNASDSSIRIA